MARSWILTIFWAWASLSEPPKTVKSLAKAKTVRPLTVPQPVTTPSPGILVFSIPNSADRCSTNMSNSSNEPLSIKSSMRSRAVSLPRLCWASMRAAPPPALAPERRWGLRHERDPTGEHEAGSKRVARPIDERVPGLRLACAQTLRAGCAINHQIRGQIPLDLRRHRGGRVDDTVDDRIGEARERH